MSARSSSSPRRRALGLSLVEILVGVAIGLIGVVAIFQAVAVWSKHTQSISSGGDAQIAGTLALFNIERDLKQAGHGIGRAPAQVMGCAVDATGTAPFQMRAVDIAASAGGAPDRINVLYGNSSFYVDQDTFTNSTATSKKLRRREGFKQGDLAIIAVNPGASAATASCQLIEITKVDDADGYTVNHDNTPYTSYYAASSPPVMPRFNSASAPLFASGTIYNLGPEPRLNSWSIAGNRALTRTDLLNGTPGMQIAEGVINLKAEYGIDTSGNGRIESTEWSASAPVNWSQVLAVRVAVLVRSRQFERTRDAGASGVQAVTPSASNPYYFGDPVGRKFRMTNVNGNDDSYNDATADPNNWRFYRYKVYERVIPLRNVLWGTFG
jgi:type IV pilus assembly protein PilW